MKQARPSVTAAWVAAARTFGELLPAELHIAEDPYGAAFANVHVPRIAKSRLGRRLALAPGLGTWIMYMQVRTRVLDDIVRAFIAKQHAGQLVLLGAGYDCRALRLRALADVPVFEVDHPATQARKQRVLAKLGAASPAHYVTWDFEARPLAELPGALALAGLDRTRPVLTIWEGVTMYLTQGAIDASLRAIHDWSAPQSQLAMTYFERTRIESPSPMMRLVRGAVRGIGEPFIWGWNRDEVEPYLAARGFAVRDNRSLDDAAYDFLPSRVAALVQGRNSCYALAEVV